MWMGVHAATMFELGESFSRPQSVRGVNGSSLAKTIATKKRPAPWEPSYSTFMQRLELLHVHTHRRLYKKLQYVDY